MSIEAEAWAVADPARPEIPAQDSPSIEPTRVHNPLAPVAEFADDKWPLAALDEPHRHRYTLNFKIWPPGFVLFAKHVAYALINHGNPPQMIEVEGNIYAKWPASGSIYGRINLLRAAVEWLVGPWSQEHPAAPVRTPADLDSDHLDDLRRWIESRDDLAGPHSDRLEILLRAWYLNPWLPDEVQWPEPRWRHENWRPRRVSQENKTKRIEAAIMAPLLEWSVAFVTEFASDILEAADEFQRLSSTLPSETGQTGPCRAVLNEYLRNGQPLPGSIGAKPRTISWASVALRHQVNPARLATVYFREFRQAGIEIDFTPHDSIVKITGRFHGRSWIPALTIQESGTLQAANRELPAMLKLLRSACLIVISYLTGARPEEVLALRRGAAPEPIISEGGSRLYTIRGHVWKGSLRQDDGSPGEPREAVWATLRVAREAVLVLEKIGDRAGTGGEYLFGADGRPVHVATAKGWIRDYIDFINDRLVPQSATPSALAVPHDVDGITLRRFRRTLAWHIRNQPAGEVVLAIQYQHLGELVGGGYAGTKQAGLNDLLAEEDWNRRRTTLEELTRLIDAGQGISGPAAQRVVDAIATVPRLLTPADERRMKKDPHLAIYDNESSVTLCAFDESMALCRRTQPDSRNPALRGDRPNLLGCVVGCKCRARTDQQLTQLADQAQALRAQADVAPLPMAQALREEAARRDQQVADFTRERIIPNADGDGS